ncbi:hypothetical protein [Cognatiyoonia sp. IB215182]|uniref:hypothetical protein n=1 Tax=Cognatiyoonia sp. IB215182 TaxID=3097353 RepID=UPI002A170AE1|nr:hypothetical protein [Cognatiyoonia sp. IB215182]MDX8355523.1 hypothetical protein [Cognatiyoonia sp. IB215182]
MKRIFRPILLIALCGALSSCTVRKISEFAVLSADTSQCTADRYQPIVTRYMSMLGPGVKRSIVIDELTNMAADISLLEPIETGQCEVIYIVDHISGVPIVDFPFPVELAVLEEPDRICVEYFHPLRWASRLADRKPSELALSSISNDGVGSASAASPICFDRS